MNNILKVRDVAEQLKVSTASVRAYTNDGRLECYRSHSGQRYFTQEQVNKFLGIVPAEIIAFYVRSSNGNAKLMETQLKQLEENYGKPIITYSDKASGLNENRKGLERLIKAAGKGEFNTLCITNKDRLTRFGFTYIEKHLKTLGVTIKILHDKEKTLQDELLQDFMSLIASFSGRFYRLRGFEQQKQLLQKAKETINEKQNTNQLPSPTTPNKHP